MLTRFLRHFAAGVQRPFGLCAGALIVLPACLTFGSAQDNSTVPSNSPEEDRETPAARQQTSTGVPDRDPYFIESDGAISRHGPRSITRSLLQTANGDLWLASWQGIIRYDGERFVNETLQNGLRRFHVFSLLEDRAGNVWFGTIGGGLYRYDGSRYDWFTVADGLPDNAIECMLQDKDGNLWFGTNRGASRYDGTSFANFGSGDGLAGGSVHTIEQDRNGGLWFGTDDGVSRYDGGRFTTFIKDDGTAFPNVRSILEDRQGKIWIGCNDGLFRFDGESIDRIMENFTGALFEDRAGDIWISAADHPGFELGMSRDFSMALYRFDGTSVSNLTRLNGQSESQIFGIMEDDSGTIWFGTTHGACRYLARTGPPARGGITCL